MNLPLLPVIVVTLAVLPWAVVSQDPVQIQFEAAPVLVRSGAEAVFAVLTVSDVLTVTWASPGGDTLGLWANGQAVLNSISQYQGRVTITATQLRVSATQLRDAGNYTVIVDPQATTGLSSSSRSVELRVYVAHSTCPLSSGESIWSRDAVTGVSMSVPSVAIEGGNVTLRCTFTGGTQTSVAWGKAGSALSSDSRITITPGVLVINPARRDDAGTYTCTVSNPVSAQTSTASLTVYYGPDTPQLSKSTQAECVGGGDAVVGQTVKLTCESDSLPPALFSWQHDGQPVATGQPDSGVLSLQIFTTNESGQYACTARNAITGGTSKQQTNLAVVGTCLSGGAVAGIVIACFVAIILIIIAIILLLRQRNVDQRLRDAIGLQKTNQNVNTLTLPQNQQNINTPQRSGHGNVNALPQNGLNNTNMVQHNGHHDTGAFPHNHSHTTNAFPHNGHPNTNSYPHNGLQNPNSFPHSGQQNPNILIQTGHSQPGTLPPTVHVNLNTLPPTDQHSSNNAQPHTVHVNLNAYPPAAGPLNQNSQPLAHQHGVGTLQHNANNANTNHQTLTQTGLSHTGPQGQTGAGHAGNPQQAGFSGYSSGNGSQLPNGLIHTGCSHPTSQTFTSHRNANTQPSSDPRARQPDPAQGDSLPRGTTRAANSHPRQMPWDRLRGTPAYPNNQDDSTDTYTEGAEYRRLTQQPRHAQPEPARGQSAQSPRQRAPADRRDIQRSNGHDAAQSRSHMDPNAQRRGAPQSSGGQPYATEQSQTAQRHSQNPPAQNPSSQMHSTARPAVSQGPAASQNAHISQVPQARTNQPDRTTQTRAAAQSRQDQRPPSARAQLAPATHNPNPLNQAALLQHTSQTQIPFTSRNQQTRAALHNPGAEARAADPGRPQPQPTQQANATGQHPPTPPPVLQPSQFQTLPRERPEHPVRLPHGHGPPNMQRHPGNMHANAHRHPGNVHLNAHIHPGNAHMHANPHRHANGHRHPTNTRPQAHAGRPRR